MPNPEENAIVQQQMEELHAVHLTLGDEQVASYYPPEMEAEAHRFGIAFTHIDGTQFHYGDCEYTFDEQKNRPFNPMINAGALVVTSLVHSKGREEKVERLLEKLRIYAGNPDLHVDEDLLAEELVSNDRNLGLSYLMRSLGMISGDLEENIALYLSICSVRITGRDLAIWALPSPMVASTR